jgi:prepilin peptidase CpaA
LPTLSNTLVVAALVAIGAISTVVDLRTRRVPNRLTLTIAVSGLALAAGGFSGVTMTSALLGMLVGLVLMLPGHVIGATGAGDVKLFAATGTLLGPAAIATAFLYTLVAGGALALAAAVYRRRLAATLGRAITLVRTGGANAADIEGRSINNRFAYAPAIAFGTIAAALGFKL